MRAERLENIGKWVLPIADHAAGDRAWDCICVWNEIPKYILPRPWRGAADALHRCAAAVRLAAGDAQDHLPRPAARGDRRRRAGGAVRAVEMGGDVVLPVRHRAAGDADRGDLSADQHLCRQPDGEAAAVRLDRRVLPDPVQHDARPELGRPQSARPVQAQRRHAMAAALASAAAGGDAVFPRRAEDRRRPVADRRGRRRIRGRRARASRRGWRRASSRRATGSTRRGCLRR